MAASIMVCRIWHESNTFNPSITRNTDFLFHEGEELVANALTAGSTLGGIIESLQSKDCEILPSFSLTGAPGGLVDHEFFEQIWVRLADDIERLKPDAVAIELHGAMGTTKLPDAEGELLKRLRKKVGSKVKIAIGLDLHAHLTDCMIHNIDICVACKENPHSDVVECGHKVAELLYSLLDGRITPTKFMVKVPMVLSGIAETASGPLYKIHQAARDLSLSNPQLLDISIFNMFPYIDDEDTGQAILVTSDGDLDNTTDIENLAQLFWDNRHNFVDELPSIAEVFDQIATTDTTIPYVLADMGDRVLAGAPGDSTIILKEALMRDDRLRGAISITDPDAVALVRTIGIGNEVTLDIGGKLSPNLRPCQITATVVGLSDGNFEIKGPFYGGEKSSLGDTAVLLVDDRIFLVLTTKPALCHDPNVFTSQGVILSTLDFIVAKSGYHFKLNFADIASPIVVRTPGLSYYAPKTLPYKKSNFWPEHELASPTLNTRVFI